MTERKLEDFKAGDRVRLVKPFRCKGDGEDLDRDFDIEIRSVNPRGTGTVLNSESTLYVRVQFDDYNGGTLNTNPDVLDFEIPPATEREVEDAIRSILEGRPG